MLFINDILYNDISIWFLIWRRKTFLCIHDAHDCNAKTVFSCLMIIIHWAEKYVMKERCAWWEDKVWLYWITFFFSWFDLSLYAKVWFSFRVLANLTGKTHKSASNLVQIEQIPRYHSHTLKTFQSFIFEVIQISVSHESNSKSYLPCLKLLLRTLKTRFNFT